MRKDLRTILAWIIGWAFGGLLIAIVVSFSTSVLDFKPLLIQSIALAEVLGISIYTSTQGIFHYFGSLPKTLRWLAQGLTLFTATMLGSLLVFLIQPLFFLANPKLMGTLVIANALLGVVVGSSLHAYNSMKRELERTYEILAQKEALERELSIARDVQQGLLPQKPPTMASVEVAGICLPAVGVGGDLYDWFELADGRLGLALADVSGKGISAALHAASLHSAIRGTVSESFQPEVSAARLNQWIYETTDLARYATMFLATFDPKSMTLKYTAAGHPPGIILRQGKIILLETLCPPIGLLEESKFTATTFQLEPDDRLLIFTDGLIESPNEEGDEFGETRLQAWLEDFQHLDTSSFVEQLTSTIKNWTGDQPAFDDLTLVLARFKV